MNDGTSLLLISAQQVSVLMETVFSGLTQKPGTLPESPEPALGGVTLVRACGPFTLPWTNVVISGTVLGKKCIFFPDNLLRSSGVASAVPL